MSHYKNIEELNKREDEIKLCTTEELLTFCVIHPCENVLITLWQGYLLTIIDPISEIEDPSTKENRARALLEQIEKFVLSDEDEKRNVRNAKEVLSKMIK